ncbi:MAG TPA: hypothetical protein VMT76_10770 [Puia sp.]|nr:hypothetical protein [Puia sp.]
MIKKPFLPVSYIFLVIAVIITATGFFLSSADSVLFSTLMAGNLILFIATFFSFGFYFKAINKNNTQAFLRMVYSAMFLKMGICIVAVLLYALIVKPVSKPAILIFFGLYFIYTFAEIRIIMRLNKEKKNA